ncbi:MAG: cytosine permease, partial [Flavisolibacter sp.]|nr:cytosine permease [Flavisolibacter sp.]
PVVLAGKFENKILVSLAMVAVAISTLATNIAANIVSPANDFSNLLPKKINFRTGGYITGIIGILIMPWKLVADPSGYIFTWLVGYSSLLGPIGGIMIADYFFIRHQQLNVQDLYKKDGVYAYKGGFNQYALIALLLGILPNVPGFFTTIGVISKDTVWPWLSGLYNYAWFTGFFVSGLTYLLLMKKVQAPQSENIQLEDKYVITH